MSFDLEAGRAPRWAVSAGGWWTYRRLPMAAPGIVLGARRELTDLVSLRLGVLGAGPSGAELEQPASTYDATSRP